MAQLNGIFDPLGSITPFTVKGNIFMRELWQLKCDWDDKFDTKARGDWIAFF